MEIEITSQKENPLLKRTEVRFRIAHPKERTPKRSVVRGEIAALLGTKKGLVIVDHLDVEFGISETKGYAKAYKTEEMMLKTERDHILKRASVQTADEGTEEKAPEAAPAPKAPAEEPAEEAPAEEKAEEKPAEEPAAEEPPAEEEPAEEPAEEPEPEAVEEAPAEEPDAEDPEGEVKEDE